MYVLDLLQIQPGVAPRLLRVRQRPRALSGPAFRELCNGTIGDHPDCDPDSTSINRCARRPAPPSHHDSTEMLVHTSDAELISLQKLGKHTSPVPTLVVRSHTHSSCSSSFLNDVSARAIGPASMAIETSVGSFTTLSVTCSLIHVLCIIAERVICPCSKP